ncbi:MAG: helix-turn-helix transcriptional regulator [Oscillospiraceae bacterium]|nr:helix-turn-helix transcriptional regulator [Oscillospiraceae bacterium]
MKIIKYWKQKNYMLQLFGTIAGFCCIPLILLQIFVIGQSAQGYSKMNEETIYENLAGSTAWFQQQTEQMSLTAIKISQDALVRNAAKKDCSPYKIYEAHNRIDQYSNDQYEVGVWFAVNDHALFRKVNITSDRLYEILAEEDPVCRQEIERFFEEEEYTRIISTAQYMGSKNDLIVLVKPVSFLSVVKKDALVFFVMDQTVVEKELQARFHDCSSVALLDEQGNLLVRGRDFTKQLCDDEDFQKFLAGEGIDIYVTSNGNENIRIYQYRDPASGYTCLVSIYEDGMEAYLREWVSDIRTILIFSIVVISVLLALTVYINYRPLKLLVSKHSDKAEFAEMSELEILDSAFLAVDEKLYDQKQQLRNFLLGDLLRGRPVEEKILTESGLQTGVCGYIVLALQGPPVNSTCADKIAEAMKTQYGCDCYITSITYQPQQLMICVLHNEAEVSDLQNQVSDLLLAVTGQNYNIYCGTLVDQVAGIRSSYLRSLSGVSEHEGGKAELDGGVAEAIRLFGESLETADVAAIRGCLEIVESRLTTMKNEEAHRRYYCYKLMTVYFAKARDMRNFKMELAHLIDFDNEAQLFEMLHQSVERFCVQHTKAEQVTANKMRTELLEYIEKNFNNKNLSLSAVADHLNTSVYVATRLFKETTGKNFKEYVMDRRMEYAAVLLKTTPHKVTEISGLAGFENAEYFSSLFKAKYGVPPTQYRKS